ncbi:hook-length control protein FliK [Poseidonocella pacifica]|uniref:Hook-length control protein FliK n=1 Tax=Poseidonocella pacifica TaxID=871651 RepID=A0A1I0XYQ8_9RHOB|nr:flagellar hook-length control protein FliK [Poseidonocella pacifica]SFB05556.1 hook-length control protein FliK [Poseidonocella pacifica]
MQNVQSTGQPVAFAVKPGTKPTGDGNSRFSELFDAESAEAEDVSPEQVEELAGEEGSDADIEADSEAVETENASGEDSEAAISEEVLLVGPTASDELVKAKQGAGGEQTDGKTPELRFSEQPMVKAEEAVVQSRPPGVFESGIRAEMQAQEAAQSGVTSTSSDEVAKSPLAAAVAPDAIRGANQRPIVESAKIAALSGGVQSAAVDADRQVRGTELGTAPGSAATKVFAEDAAKSPGITQIAQPMSGDVDKAEAPRLRAATDSLPVDPPKDTRVSVTPPQVQATATAIPNVPISVAEMSMSADPVSTIETELSIQAQPQEARSASPGQAAMSHPFRHPAGAQFVSAQIAQVVKSSQTGTVEISLNPQELGRVRLSISPTEAGVHVTLNVERPETADFLRRNADALMQEFDGAGYESVTYSFDQSMTEQGQDDTPQDSAEMIAFGIERSDDPVPASAQRVASLPAAGRGGLDIRL